MEDIRVHYIKSLQKRQDALDKFKNLKMNFFLSKEKVTKEIEEARKIWQSTMEQLPKHKFEL